MRPRRRRFLVGVLTVSIALCLVHPAPRAQQPQHQVFRAGVLLVPVDVRVVDKDGNPITDLTRADFTVFENGVRQEIAQFSTQAYLGDLEPDAPRTFFIILGRGRLNSREKGIDALIDCVRAELQPQDRVAVLGYLHMTELTTDHAAILRLLERYREGHGQIEEKIARDRARFLGAPTHPLQADTQLDLQSLFFAPGLPRVRLLPGASGGRGLAYSDLNYLRSAITYLRWVDGEKQVVLLVDQALRASGDVMARDAAAARTTVSVIQAGGVRQEPQSSDLVKGRLFFGSDILLLGDQLNARDDRALAAYTGGYAVFYRDVPEALAKLVRATSLQYLLGYYPAQPPREGEFRDVRVEVDRPGAFLLYRHAYEAQPPLDPGPPDLRRIFSEDRIRRAAAFSAEEYLARYLASPNIPYTSVPARVSATVTSREGNRSTVRVEVTANANYVTFARLDRRYTAWLDIAAFVTDRAGATIGEAWDRIDLDLDEKALSRLRRERIRHTLTVSVTGDPHDVKVVLYEYSADRTGMATARVK